MDYAAIDEWYDDQLSEISDQYTADLGNGVADAEERFHKALTELLDEYKKRNNQKIKNSYFAQVLKRRIEALKEKYKHCKSRI